MSQDLFVAAMATVSISFVFIVLSLNLKRSIRWLGFLLLIPVVLSILNLHAISSAKIKLVLLLLVAFAYMLATIIHRWLQDTNKVSRLSIIVGLNMILAGVIAASLLGKYLVQMALGSMTYLFASVIVFQSGTVHGHFILFGLLFVVLGSLIGKLAHTTVNLRLLTVTWVLFFAGAIYTLGIQTSHTFYFFKEIANKSVNVQEENQDPAQHAGLMYIARALYKDSTPLNKEQNQYHYSVAHTLLSAGLIGLTAYLAHLFITAKDNVDAASASKTTKRRATSSRKRGGRTRRTRK